MVNGIIAVQRFSRQTDLLEIVSNVSKYCRARLVWKIMQKNTIFAEVLAAEEGLEPPTCGLRIARSRLNINAIHELI